MKCITVFSLLWNVPKTKMKWWMDKGTDTWLDCDKTEIVKW